MTYNRETYLAKQQAKAIARNKPIQAFANHAMYSDVEPYEVIEKRTENKVVIRSMKAEHKDGWKPNMITGGFSFHCTNNEDQRNAWEITPDEGGKTITIRWSKAKCRWQDAHGNRYFMSEHPVKKYDYNF